MSCLPPKKEETLLYQALKQAELEQKNKEAAKEALLKIQLMLAQRTS